MTDTPATTIAEPDSAKRAVIYLRVSTQKQVGREDADGYSLPAQREACVRKAEQLGAQVVDVYVDRGESAKTAERPQFQAMLARIRDQRDVDYVILDKIDRFARNRRDDANILFDLRLSGAQLVSVKENVDDTPAGQLLHAIMAGIAEFYSKNLATEALKGMTQKAMQGGTPGRAPIGYLNTRKRIEGREVRTVMVDPDRAPHISWAFDAYASGEYAISSLADALAERGLRALPQGAGPAKPLVRGMVFKMLTNRYYLGIVKFNGAEYPGLHEAIVSDDTFERVQELLHSRFLAGEKRRIHHHYLKGTVYCASCGSRMTITVAKRQYFYYYCLGRQMKRTECQQRFLSVEAVEKAVERHYATVRMPEPAAELIRAGLRAEIDRQHRRSGPEMEAARRRIDELEQERRRLARGVVTGAIPDDLAREEQDRIATEAKRAKAILTAAETVHASIDATLSTALSFVGRAADAYLLGGPRVRRLSNQFFFHKLLIGDPDHQVQVVSAQVREPWATLLAAEVQAQMVQITQNATNPDQVDLGPGSRMIALVPPVRLELTLCGI